MTLHREIHTLKGTAREIGVRNLASRAEFWELRLKTENITGVEDALDELQVLFEEAAAALQAWNSASR